MTLCVYFGWLVYTPTTQTNLMVFVFMENRFYKVDFLSFYSSCTTQYSRIFDKEKMKFLVTPKILDFENLENSDDGFAGFDIPKFSKHRETGLSAKGKSNLKHSLETLCNLVSPSILVNGKDKKKITLCTLTLASPQIERIGVYSPHYYASDKEIKKYCLNQLLTEYREIYPDLLYCWVAEKQMNGSIHFHMLLNKYIPYDDILDRWNRLQNKFGFVDRYQEKMCSLSYSEYLKETNQKENEKTLKAYLKGVQSEWKCPNSVSVESPKGDIIAYLVKYMTKGHIDEKAEKYLKNLGAEHGCDVPFYKSFYEIGGRIWQCSQQISKKRKFVCYANDYLDEFSALCKDCKILVDETYLTVCHKMKDVVIKAKTLFADYFSFLRVPDIRQTAETVVNEIFSPVAVPVASGGSVQFNLF